MGKENEPEVELLTVHSRTDVEQVFRYSAGRYLNRFLTEMRDKARIIGVKCETCSTPYFPRRSICPKCRRKGKVKEHKFAGNGKIFSHTTIRVAPEGFEAYTPYVVAIVELEEGTFLDMMYMPDAMRAAIEIMEADADTLKHRNAFNVSAMTVAPETIAAEIKKIIPEFSLDYKIDLLRQEIADSWPNSLDDGAAREEWGWNSEYNLESMSQDMIENIKKMGTV